MQIIVDALIREYPPEFVIQRRKPGDDPTEVGSEDCDCDCKAPAVPFSADLPLEYIINDESLAPRLPLIINILDLYV